MLSKDIFVPLTISIDQTRRALVIVLPCYGALEIVGVIIIIISDASRRENYQLMVILLCSHLNRPHHSPCPSTRQSCTGSKLGYSFGV